MKTVKRASEIVGSTDNRGNEIVGSPATSGRSVIEFLGKNCVVTFEDKSSLDGSIILLRDNARVHIGKRSMFRGRMTLGLDCGVFFGDDVYTGLDLQITTAEGADVTLGSDILISSGCRIRADDSHPIYDGKTGKRINQSASVRIGNHVWLGQEAFVLPGSSIGDGSVIGARSLVTKTRPIPPNSLALGTPASVQRENIRWIRKHLQTGTDIEEEIAPIF